MTIRRLSELSRRRIGGALTVLLLLTAGSAEGLAQDDPAQASPQAEQAPAAADSGSDRIGRLQAQINELQAMVAALTSLVKQKPEVTLPQEAGNPGKVQPMAADPGLTARVDALETRLGALNDQIESLTQQLGAMQSGGGAAEPQPDAAQPSAPPEDAAPPDESPMPMTPPGRQGEASPDSPPARYASAEQAPGAPAARAPAEPDTTVASAEELSGLGPEALYNQGYGDLLRRDYGSAERAFATLVGRFPKDQLAGKAQYWLGETYYVRGDFKAAADAFLKSYNLHKAGDKAPDSLVRLSMALGELGQKDAACATLGQFKTAFPSADAVLRDQARSEAARLGC